MKITVFIRHGLDLELADLLEKVPTENDKEVCGELIAVHVSDPDELPADIRRIAKKAEYINSIRSKVCSPWAARDVIEGKAVIVDDKLVYLGPRSYLRTMLQSMLGLSDEEFKTVMYMATDDIRANNIAHNKKTTMEEVIKIAAQCAEALRRCGR